MNDTTPMPTFRPKYANWPVFFSGLPLNKGQLYTGPLKDASLRAACRRASVNGARYCLDINKETGQRSIWRVQ